MIELWQVESAMAEARQFDPPLHMGSSRQDEFKRLVDAYIDQRIDIAIDRLIKTEARKDRS